jgi:ankyrin repeat protein
MRTLSRYELLSMTAAMGSALLAIIMFTSSTPSIEERMNRIDLELIVAARDNNVLEVRRLLRAGADVNAKGHGDWTPLHLASIKGHAPVIIELLDHGADTQAKDIYGATPLHLACHRGHSAAIKELLGHGAGMEAKDRDGITPLHYASCNGHVANVQALLSGGANILAASDAGRLPIHHALGEGHSAVSKCLLQQLYATTRRLPLHKLLEDLAWIGHRNCRHYPPLRYALDHNILGTDNVVEILEYMVGQNPELLRSGDQDGSLPLHVACRLGVSCSIVQSLVDLYKASVKSVTQQGDLPLFLACQIPETSLDTIFVLVKLYPDLVYR